jgi:hypothetical protein
MAHPGEDNAEWQVAAGIGARLVAHGFCCPVRQ